MIRPDGDGRYLDELFGCPLTLEQRAVVRAPLEPRLVVAGAGSGKTTVMAARVVHAVAVHGLAPGEVLGLTFTTKAAGELRQRVRTALARLQRPVAGDPVAGDPGAAPDADELPTVATYHAYAAGLVRDHALRIGREPDARQLSEAASWQLAMGVVRRHPGPFAHLRWTPSHVAALVLALDAELAEHGATIDDVRREDSRLRRLVATAARATKDVQILARTADERDELLVLVEDYRRRKRDLDVLDFADQIALAGQLAGRCPEVGGGERDRFRLVLLDEYQDTSVGQRVLLQALYAGGHPVTAVGDPCQAIYGWRGASVGNLLRFPEHFPRTGSTAGSADRYQPDYLLTSFRNTMRVLEVANALSAVVRDPPAGAPGPRVAVPQLSASAPAALAGEVRASWHADVAAEAEALRDALSAAHRGGTAWREMAVLARTKAQVPVLHRALTGAGIPVEVVGLGGLLEMPEVADVVAVLEVLADSLANPALLRVLTGPRYRIGPRDLAVLGRRAAALAQEGGLHVPVGESGDDPDGSRALHASTAAVDACDVVALSDAVASPGDPTRFSAAALDRLAGLRAELDGLRAVSRQPVVEAVATVVSAIGLDVEVVADPGGSAAARAANLAAFSDAAVRFEAVEEHTDLAAFLDYLAAAREREDGWDPGSVSAADTVKLMTVHKAKGLEWDVVAVPGLVDKTFPSDRGRPSWTSRAEALPVGLRGDRADLPPEPAPSKPALDAHRAAAKELDLLEERRLVYVAVTRARRLLLTSGAVWNETVTRPRRPGPFLEEIRRACDAGAGPVGPWCTDSGTNNPFAAAAGDVDYPPLPDTARLARRRAAARLVAEHRGGLGAESDHPPPPGARAARWQRETRLLLAELAEEAGQRRSVPLPATLTASQLVRLAADPAGLAADLARPMPRRPSRAARRGTAFHAWVEQRLGARVLLRDEEVPGAADPDHPDDVALGELAEAFERSPYAARSPVAVEVPFQVAVAGRVLRGRIDAVFAERSDADGSPRWEVVDWKTGSSAPDPLQLAVYRLAWARLQGVAPGQVSAAFLQVPDGWVARHDDLPDEAGLAALLAG